MKSGLEIAQEAVLRPIADVAASSGLAPDEIEPYGTHRAKVSLSVLDRLAGQPDGKLVITTAITPTKAGEGKTTTSVSLTQGLGVLGKKVALALREPSLGPVFGIKGGGTGGGYAQVVPMEDINLHFNGDFHAVTAAHNLLAAAIDASIFHGNPLGIDPQMITWPRTMDVNDRELRRTVVGLGGKAHGIGSNLGFQKFCDIVCRLGGFAPTAGVLVTTVRATKSHGGMPFGELGSEDLDALRRGIDNLEAHVGIIRRYGLPCVVSINNFPTDTEAELELIHELAVGAGAETVVVNRGFAEGGKGAVDLAEAVVAACERPSSFHQLTPDGTPLREQIDAIATTLYGADGVDYLPQAETDLARMERLGFGAVPVCMAKTHLSLSHEPTWLNRPRGYRLPVRGVVPASGAGFVVALCGEMQRMPGLGRTPNFTGVDIGADGRTTGL